MKLLTFRFTRDWQSARSIPGTGEVEHAPAGRDTDTASYLVASVHEEPLARAALLSDFSHTDPKDVVLEDTIDVNGVVTVQRRFV